MSEPRRIVEEGVMAGNVSDEYGTSNPIARRLMAGFQDAVDALLRRSGAAEVHEVGCGEGRLAAHLSELGLPRRRSDLSEQVVAVPSPLPWTVALCRKRDGTPA